MHTWVNMMACCFNIRLFDSAAIAASEHQRAWLFVKLPACPVQRCGGGACCPACCQVAAFKAFVLNSQAGGSNARPLQQLNGRVARANCLDL